MSEYETFAVPFSLLLLYSFGQEKDSSPFLDFFYYKRFFFLFAGFKLFFIFYKKFKLIRELILFPKIIIRDVLAVQKIA